jgi:hypothetical protein
MKEPSYTYSDDSYNDYDDDDENNNIIDMPWFENGKNLSNNLSMDDKGKHLFSKSSFFLTWKSFYNLELLSN